MNYKEDCEQIHVINIYNKIAPHFSSTRVFMWDWIKEFINNQPIASNILDIGCGNGRNMQRSDVNFTGIDGSYEFVKMCTDKQLNAVLGDMCSLPFKSHSFYHIISIASFHHLSTIDRRIKAIDEMYRVLKPGGSILLSIWSIKQPRKSKRQFSNYGDTLVKWNSNNNIYDRYYYIFSLTEIIKLLERTFKIKKHTWGYGNEIFILTSD